jgi:hypothetical protein
MTDSTTIRFRFKDWEGDWHVLIAQRWAFDIRPHDWDDQIAAWYLGRQFSGNIAQAAADALADQPWLGNIAFMPKAKVHAQRPNVSWLTQCGLDFSQRPDSPFPLIVDMPVTCKSCLR